MSSPSTQRSRSAGPLLNWKWRIAFGYLALLIVSHVVRWVRAEKPLIDNNPAVMVKEINAERRTNKDIRLAYREYRPSATDPQPVVILIHGSPGRNEDFRSLAPQLAKRYRVIAPDLPGFGGSTEDVPDYSIRAHARYVVELMDTLGIERAHLLGFSMGGGVVLNIADIAPDRVQSITMLSAIGVQEAELFGDYHLNHALHGAQLAAIWMLKEAAPHFGALDHSMLGMSYARNFYDSDQRPLREILSRFE